MGGGAFANPRSAACPFCPGYLLMCDLELTPEEISGARDPRWKIIGASGTHLDSLTVLKLAFGNRETEVVSVDDVGIAILVSVLKAIGPKFDSIEALPITVDPETGRITASIYSE
jgi:hypothetical protein